MPGYYLGLYYLGFDPREAVTVQSLTKFTANMLQKRRDWDSNRVAPLNTNDLRQLLQISYRKFHCITRIRQTMETTSIFYLQQITRHACYRTIIITSERFRSILSSHLNSNWKPDDNIIIGPIIPGGFEPPTGVVVNKLAPLRWRFPSD